MNNKYENYCIQCDDYAGIYDEICFFVDRNLNVCIVTGTSITFDLVSFKNGLDRNWNSLQKEILLRPATRKEIIKSGLWDFVQNKDSTSCKEDELEKLSDELESYLDLADKDNPTA